jgi:hypothetical protein
MKVDRLLKCTDDWRSLSLFAAIVCALLSTKAALAASNPAAAPVPQTPVTAPVRARKPLELTIVQARLAALAAKTEISSAHHDCAQAIASTNQQLADAGATLRANAAAWQKRNARVVQVQAAQKSAKPMTMAELGQLETELQSGAPQMSIDVSQVGEDARQALVNVGVTVSDQADRAKDAATKAASASAQLARVAAADEKAKQPPDAALAKALTTAKEVKKIAADAQQEASGIAREIASAGARRDAKQAELATLKQRAQAEQQRFDKTFATLTTWVAAHAATPASPSVPGNTTPPSTCPAANLNSALPPGAIPIRPTELAPSYGGYPSALFNDTSSPVMLAIAAIDPDFATDISGPAEENSALRLPDKRGLLIISGCHTAHECDTTSFVIVYDATNRRAGLINQTPTPNLYLVRGTYDAAVRAVLLNTAHKKLLP